MLLFSTTKLINDGKFRGTRSDDKLLIFVAFDRGLDELESKLKDGMVVSEYLEELQSLRTAMQKDLDALSG